MVLLFSLELQVLVGQWQHLGLSAAICGAIAGIVEVAGGAIKGWAVNADGSVSLCLSYHYTGTRNAGMDLTAVPVPGLDVNQWFGLVNGLMRNRTNSIRATELGIENEPLLKISELDNFLINGQTEGSPVKQTEQLTFSSKGGFYETFSSCMSNNWYACTCKFVFNSRKSFRNIICNLYCLGYLWL